VRLSVGEWLSGFGLEDPREGCGSARDTAGQSFCQESLAVVSWYSILTGIALSRSKRWASARIGHQSYKNTSSGRHIATQPTMRSPSRMISARRVLRRKFATAFPIPIDAPRNATAIIRLIRPRPNSSRSRRRESRARCLKYWWIDSPSIAASSVCPALRSRWTTNANRASRGRSRAHSTMNCSARGSRSRSRKGEGSIALKSWRSSATRTSITRHCVGIVSPADERARDIDPSGETIAIRHNSSECCGRDA
jgi:hypothetical protein